MSNRFIEGIAIALIVLPLFACSPAADGDARLQQQVTDALSAASDLPQNRLTVSVEDGVVTVSGSLDCEACGGTGTPGGTGTVQQSLGAVIRAVPGVESVIFQLQSPGS